MIVAAHQPQYLPWLGYFHKMAACDLFVYLDDVQYKKREFQNRNRIRVKEGELWLTVPVLSKGRFDQEVREVEIDPTASWAKDHWTAIQLAYRHSPHFNDYAPELEAIYKSAWTKLSDLSLALIEFHRKHLGIRTPICRSSALRVETAKTRRLVDLCRLLGADVYLSGQGARDYLEEERFTQGGIRLLYQNFQHPFYPQAYAGFQTYMAALDLLMNCGPKSRDILLRQPPPIPAAA
jgi:hypothetical protein